MITLHFELGNPTDYINLNICKILFVRCIIFPAILSLQYQIGVAQFEQIWCILAARSGGVPVASPIQIGSKQPWQAAAEKVVTNFEN